MNSRLDEIQASILRVKLPFLDEENRLRGDVAKRYNILLAEQKLILPDCRKNSLHGFHLYVVQCDRRDDLLAFLKTREIAAGIHYPCPVHQQPAYLGRLDVGSMAETEQVASRIISLPIHPGLAEAAVITVAEAVLAFDWGNE